MCPFPSIHLILSHTQQHYYARTSNYRRPAYALKMHKSVCIINVCTHMKSTHTNTHSPMVEIFSHMVFFPIFPSSLHVIAVATGFLFETILSTEERDGETGKGSLGMLLLILLQFFRHCCCCCCCIHFCCVQIVEERERERRSVSSNSNKSKLTKKCS